MKTTIYLMRHSKTLKVNHVSNNDSILLQNEKSILSIEGETLAYNHSKNNEFDNIDVVISSNYTRAIATAKYIAERNNKTINIIEGFNERKHGIDSWKELPKDFEIKQFNDEKYKVGNGESQEEVRNRMYNSLMKVLNDYKGSRIVVISHSTAIMYLLKKWCEIEFCKYIKYKDKVLFEGESSYCLTFKLIFNDEKLENIERVR